MDNNFSMRKLNTIARKLRFHDGDILLVKMGTPLAESSTMKFLAEELTKAGFKRGLVIALPDFDEISALDEATLNKHGWFHVDALAKLIQKKKELESDDTHQDVPGA